MTDTPKFASYMEAQDYQLREWAEGRPWHNYWSPIDGEGDPTNKAHGECCPDFSCCVPESIWPRERRYSFVEAGDEQRYKMLFGALTNLVEGHDVYVAGGVDKQT